MNNIFELNWIQVNWMEFEFNQIQFNIASQNCQLQFKPPQTCDHKLQARLGEIYSWIVIQYCVSWYTSQTIANYKHQSFPQVLVNCTFWKASNDTVQWHLLQFVYSNPDGGKHQENHCLWLLQCAQPKILYIPTNWVYCS
jgi:hypothetical protein